MTQYDLIVVGGGPAGCATALTAATNGAKILLLERGRFPRNKVCGEFVSAESLELLHQLLVSSDRVLISRAPRISQGRIFADGAEIHAQIHPPAASITRFDLDAALWRSCLERGIDAREGNTVQRVEGQGPFVVEAQSELFHGRAVVNATGRWSNLTRPAARSEKERLIGVKAHFCEADPPASVDLYFFDGGYCGVQPIPHDNGSGAINACALVSATVARTIQEIQNLHPALRERSRNWLPLTDPVTTSPLIFRRPEPVKDGILQVGDAANFVDPFVGDGISLALRSGVLAAECLLGVLRGKSDLGDAAARYEAVYRKRLSHVFRASSMLRKFMGWPAPIRRPVLALARSAPLLTRRLVAMTR